MATPAPPRVIRKQHSVRLTGLDNNNNGGAAIKSFRAGARSVSKVGGGAVVGREPSFRLPNRLASRSAVSRRDNVSRRTAMAISHDFGASVRVVDMENSMSGSMASLHNSMSRCNSEASKTNDETSAFNDSMKFTVRNFVAQKEDSLEDHYIIGELLGEGGFGEVYACSHIETGQERAVKVIMKQHDEEDLRVIDEFETVKDLDHPNILKMYALFESETCFFLVCDIYAGGELYDELAEFGRFAEDEASILMNNVLSCINYCHKRGLVHRDLKPENILLEENKSFDDLKVIDFGLAQYGDTFSSLDGSTYYLSPQVVKGSYGLKTDIWSCGVIAFVCLAGYAPFEGDGDDAVMQAILDGAIDFEDPVWDEISDEAKDFVAYLLTYNEHERPSAEEALQHPWVKNSRRKRSSDCTHHRESTRLSLGGLQSFQANSKLKQCVCSLIASQLLRKDEKEEIDMVFRTLDYDCDGKLTPEDLKQSYKEFFNQELCDEDIEDMFAHVNYSGSGAIEYSEFVASTLMERSLIDEAKLQAAFNIFDRNNKGYISNDDFRQALALDATMDDYIMNKIIQQVDANGDGKIQYDEFKDMMLTDEIILQSTHSHHHHNNPDNRKSPRTVAAVAIEEESSEATDKSDAEDPLARVGRRTTNGGVRRSTTHSFKNVLELFQDKARRNDMPKAIQRQLIQSKIRRPNVC